MTSFGSVCSGIEAASVAWDSLGLRSSWFAEIEPFPSAVLAHRWPSTPNLGDMTTLAERVTAREIDAPDVLVGGTPCQAFSVAGLRKSLEDSRGQLSLAYCRLANAIDAVRRGRGDPECVIVWENVPGVLSTKDNAFGCFLAGLAGEIDALVPPGGKWSNAGAVFGPTRTVCWRILDAQYFGVAQRRRRVFVVASARKGFDPCAVLFESKGMRRDSAPSRGTGESVAGTLTRSAGERGAEDPERGQLISRGPGPRVECAGVAPCLAANGKAAGSATNQDAENGALVAVYGGNNTGGAIDVAPGLNAKGGSGRMDFESEALCVSLRGREGSGTAELGGTIANALRASQGGGDKPHVLCVTGEITHALTQSQKGATEDGTGHGTPIVACREVAATLTGNYGKQVDNSDTALGPNIVAAFAENSRAELRYEDGDGQITGAISTGGGKPGQGTPMAQVGAQVRRLTPTECERLQGFPDGYTLVPYRGKPAADGPRYKALGNSMAVPVMRWIGGRVLREMGDE